MTLEHDPRTGREVSRTVTVGSGDGNAPSTPLTIPSDALFKPTRVKVEYGGSAATQINLWDEAGDVSQGDLSDQRDTFTDLSNNAVQTHEGPWGDFEDDVTVNTDGNQDDDVEVTVYGVVMTDLQDMVSF